MRPNRPMRRAEGQGIGSTMTDAGGRRPESQGATTHAGGDAGDAINLQGDWSKDGPVSNPFGAKGSFDIYTSGAATLLVESELAVTSGGAAAVLELATLNGTNGFTLADPNDRGMMDVVGFDTTAPAVIADFVRT